MWMQRPGTPAWPDPAWHWLMERKGQILCAGAEVLFIAQDPGGWAPGSQPVGPHRAGGPAVLRCRVQAAVWGSWGLGRCCWLCCHPHVAQSLRKSLGGTRRGRGMHRFSFPFYPWAWRRLEGGDAAPSEEGCLSPGRVSEGLPQPLIAFSWWYEGVRLAWLAVSGAVFPLLVQSCHHFLGDNLQCPVMAQELLCHPVSYGAVAARLLVPCSQSLT